MDPRSFKIFTGECVHLKNVSNWRYSYTYCTYHIQNFALTFLILGVIGWFMR